MSHPDEPAACPRPDPGSDGDRISLGHGDGGRLTRRLIRERIAPAFAGTRPRPLGDAAELPACEGRLAFTTDGFVVAPLFFPGGDIGSLAVHGTVNDLAVAGAEPLWMSLGLILEEGLPLATLDRVIASAAAAARRAGIEVVAGDTKVVPRGAADGLFVTAAGIGRLVEPVPPGPEALRAGDILLVSGPIGRHGIAVLAAREDLGLDPPPASDSAPLFDAVAALRRAGVPVRALRDATRGGVGAVLHEWAEASGLTLVVDEPSLPVTPDVRGACELLGLDPIHLANEGTMVVAVPAASQADALAALAGVRETARAAPIGCVRARGLSPVLVRRALGREQPLDEPIAGQLPRIC